GSIRTDQVSITCACARAAARMSTRSIASQSTSSGRRSSTRRKRDHGSHPATTRSSSRIRTASASRSTTCPARGTSVRADDSARVAAVPQAESKRVNSAHGVMDLDLDDPTLFLRDDVVADPRPLYDTLRRRAPVWRLPGQDSYLVADPTLIREVVGRPSEFSSNLVSLLHRDADGCPAALPMAPFGDPVHGRAPAPPPRHPRHRRLLQPPLNPAAVAQLEPTLRRVVEEQLAPMLAAGRGDAVTSLGDPVPALAICYLVGLPPDDASCLVP